jgi:hemoglobin-like flavoprotein
MDVMLLKTFQASLARCDANGDFLDRFYEVFLASSPLVKEKFAHTDFERQKKALRSSLDAMALAAADEEKGPAYYLQPLAERHSRRELGIGAALYDDWLDSLLTVVQERDSLYTPEVREAWERVMMVGIGYLLSKY